VIVTVTVTVTGIGIVKGIGTGGEQTANKLVFVRLRLICDKGFATLGRRRVEVVTEREEVVV
jgi:hypothetical protein